MGHTQCLQVVCAPQVTAQAIQTVAWSNDGSRGHNMISSSVGLLVGVFFLDFLADLMPLQILNTMFIPRGVISNENKDNKAYETTSFTVIKLPQLKRFYYKDYNNQQWKMIDLNRLDFSEYTEFPLADGTLGVKDVTETINEGRVPRNVPTNTSPSPAPFSSKTSKSRKRNDWKHQKKEVNPFAK